jgi:hypothetical protein
LWTRRGEAAAEQPVQKAAARIGKRGDGSILIYGPASSRVPRRQEFLDLRSCRLPHRPRILSVSQKMTGLRAMESGRGHDQPSSAGKQAEAFSCTADEGELAPGPGWRR